MKDGEPCTSRGVSTVLEGVTPRPRTKGSMAWRFLPYELYTMQRYLQYGTLAEKNLQHFDAWASTFGETVTALEIAPEGNGYRLKTRFARFYNLPELMQMFREVADIQTADMLNLPVPEAEYRVVKVKPTKLQEEMVEELGNRAERVRNNEVNPREDNMLKITNDGRKLALDQRLSNPLLPDDPRSKVNACVEEIYRHWEDGKEKKLTQLVFCDLSTPKTDGTFSVYNDIRDKLLARGIPPEEIAFIHDANTDVRKKELFSKVRRGAVRILMGSTFKMGAGTNVQDRIIASHDLDCPWRPRDLEQRAGRTIRQGNQNPKVEIIRYVTEGTFDAYLYQTIENKPEIYQPDHDVQKSGPECGGHRRSGICPMRRSRRLPPETRTLRKRWIWIYRYPGCSY